MGTLAQVVGSPGEDLNMEAVYFLNVVFCDFILFKIYILLQHLLSSYDCVILCGYFHCSPYIFCPTPAAFHCVPLALEHVFITPLLLSDPSCALSLHVFHLASDHAKSGYGSLIRSYYFIRKEIPLYPSTHILCS